VNQSILMGFSILRRQ